MRIDDLETPSVLIDLEKMETNIARMQKRCDDLGLKFRPHIKTHKIPDIAKMQMEAGAVGIACQKVSEAEVFAEAGLNDIQIPYNIVGPKKANHLADLALYNRMTVSADSETVVNGLAEAAEAHEIALRVMIELETDLHRAGAPMEDALELAKMIDSNKHLTFAGVLLYPSNPVMRPILQELLSELDKAGIPVESISGGGTGAALVADQMPELTELRVGTYIFNDWGTVLHDWASEADCAMTVLATVVSHAVSDRVVLDCGSKTLSSDTMDGLYGHIVEYPEAKVYRLNEEHGYVDVSACEHKPDVGERVHVIPMHTCVVTNLHNQLFGVRGEDVEVIWPVAARGLVW